MNKKQKQMRLFLAIGLIVLLVILLLIALGISCSKSGCGSKSADASGSSDVIISEILVTNKETVKDPFGGYGDYIELYNRTDRDVDLTGYTLADDERSSWAFPDGTIIPANGYLVVWCVNGAKKAEQTGVLAANFQLSTKVKEEKNNHHDVLRLSHRTGIVIQTIDLAQTFANIYTGGAGNSKSFVRGEDGWITMDPTPGFPNTDEGRKAYLASIGTPQSGLEPGATQDPRSIQKIACQVRVTEFMPSNGSTHKAPNGEFCDWIELYNSGDSAFDLSGYHLSDETDKFYKFTFPEGTIIGGKQYLLLYHTEQSVEDYKRIEQTSEGFFRFEFGLSASGNEVLTFSDKDGNFIDVEPFSQVQKDYSFARVYTNGQFDPNASCVIESRPTPGFDNTVNGRALFESKENGQMGVHDLAFSEVLVDGYYISYEYSSKTKSDRPVDADLGSWIELYNRSDSALDISGYSISDNEKKPRKWVFPDGTSIAAKGYLVLQLEGSLPREYTNSVKDVTDEQRRNTLNFDIAAAGETVYLYDASGSMIDRVTVPEARSCVSYGRDASGEWKLFDKPTEGEKNDDASAHGIYCEAATADTHSGIYSGVQTVNVTVPEGCYATYTLSCGKENDPVKKTTPTASSDRVSGPIAIKENTVLRIRTFANDGSRYPSDVKSYTYIIIGAEETVEAHNTNLPVVFLVTDPENLWDTKTGIMVKGDDYTGKGAADEMRIGKSEDMGKYANFNMRGLMWERPTTFTYTTPGGTDVLYETDLNIRIFGAFSRKIAQKGIALLARKGVGSSRLDYKFFKNRPWTSYKSLVLRASGQDAALSRIRDVMIQGLLDDAKVDIANQAYIQCIVYINGQYWGVYKLREKISKCYIAQHYGIEDVDSLDILKWNGNNDQCVVCGDGLQDYKELIKFCEDRNCDLSNAADYQYVCERVDADQFAMYCAFEIIIGNTDTGNIKWWRSSELDNKWRWIQYDYCWAMNGDNPNQQVDKSTGFRRDYFWKYFDPAGHGAGKGFSTVLGRSMMSNNEFVKLFLKHCANFYNNVFRPDQINAKVTELQENIRKEMETYDLVRWRPYHDLSTKGWNSHVNKIRNYADNYQDWFLYYCQQYINKHTHYHLSDEEMIELFGKVGKIS